MSKNTVRWWITGIVVFAAIMGMAGIALAQTSTTQPFQIYTNDKIEADLVSKLSTGPADFIVRFKNQADLSLAYQMSWDARGEYVYNALRETAKSSQAQAQGLLDGLGLHYQTFIAGNELYVWGGDLGSAQSLATLPEVEFIRETSVYHVDPVFSVGAGVTGQDPISSMLKSYDIRLVSDIEEAQPNAPATLDWGITDTGADQFWSAFGFQGDGIVVANIDTGVDYTHAALNPNYKCAANPSDPACWVDPDTIDCSGPGGGPCDTIYFGIYHGTHTMGTMVAEDDPGLAWQVGMAPNAQWIACLGCPYGSCPDYDLNYCADWILAPDGDPANRPNIVNNSWGGYGGNSWYLDKVNAWRAAGIFPAFSAGNNYSCNSLGSPGDYQESFGSAAHDNTRMIADFSSKGPSAFGDDPYTKPNLSAPGVDIVSTQPGDSWTSISGTSMASPHTAGAVALLWSCNPGLVGQIDQTFQILQNSADASPAGSCGAPTDGEGNFTYGYGYLDIYNTGLQWCGNVGTLQGTVTDLSTGSSIPLAHVFSTPGPFQTSTDDTGFYQMAMLIGAYDITVDAFGYYPQTVPVLIITDTTTIQDFALDPQPAAIVSGTITDAITGWPLYASIDIAGYPYNPVWSDPVTGHYQVSLPVGTAYDFTVNAWSPGYLAAARTIGPFSGDVTENFSLDADLNTCNAPGYTFEPYREDFEMDNGGFNKYSYGTGNNSWEWGQPYPYPEPHSGSNVWATNLSGNYYDNEDGYIESPDIDLSSLLGQWFGFSWWQWLTTDGWGDYAEVQVSNDGGINWTTVYGPVTGYVDWDWAQHSINLDPTFAVGNFRVRFHFWSNDYDTRQGWYLDDLQVGACQPQAGGLVVGNVYDTNLGMPLTGAGVSNDSGESTTTGVTADPAVDDSFYTLFSLAGTHIFTATYPSFNSVITPVNVISGGTVLQDFYLPAGHLVANPDSLWETILLGTSETITMNLTNDGDGSAGFEILEWDRSQSQSMGEAVPDPDAAQPGAIRSGVESSAAPVLSRSTGVQSGECVVAVGAGWDPEATQLHNTLTEFGFSWIDVNSVQEARNAGANVLIDHYAASTMYVPDISAWINDGFGYIQLGDWPQWFPSSWDSRTSGTPLDIQVMDSSHPLARGLPSSWTGLGFWAYDWSEDAVGYVWDTSYPNIIAAGYGALYDRAVSAVDYNTGKAVYIGVNVYGYAAGDADKRLLLNAIQWSGDCGSMDIPWLSESPITGTVAADSTQPIDVTFDATLLGQPGDYLAELRVDNDTPYGTLNIPVTMTVVPPADWGMLQGIVQSQGYCDSNPYTLEEASIVIQGSNGMTWTLATNDAGYYSWWLDQDYSPYAVTVSYPEHVDGVASGVMIVGGGTTTQNFDLRWLKPCVSADQDSVGVSVDMGSTATYTLNLINDGAVAANFELRDSDAGFGPVIRVGKAPVLVPGNQVSVGGGNQYATQGLVEHPAFTYQPSANAMMAPNTISVLLVSAYDAYQIQAMLLGYPDLYPVDFFDARYATPDLALLQGYDAVVVMSNNAFADPISLGNVLADYVDGGGGVIQTVPTFYDPSNIGWGLRGRFVNEGYNVFVGSGDWFTWADLGNFDSSHPIMEAVTYASDYFRQMMTMTPDAEWVADWTDDEFIATKGNVVGLNTFLVDGYSWYGDVALIVHNSLVWLQMGGDALWLSENPTTGVVNPDGGMQEVSLSFDASIPEVAQPGEYYATLQVRSDDPVNDRLNIPITMTVQPPANWGKLTGVISSLGYCDLNPSPLEEANVIVEVNGLPYTVTTKADGLYVVWMPEGTITATVTAEEHLGAVGTAEIVAGEVSTLDFDLRWIAACVQGEATAYDVQVPWHFSLDVPFNVVNAGAGSAEFELSDRTVKEITLAAGEFATPQALVPEAQQQSGSTKGLTLPEMPVMAPLDAGDLLQSWTPTQNDLAWGIAYDGDDETVWVGDGWAYENTIFEYEQDGSPTGASHLYNWSPYYGPADSAFNWNTGMLWTLDVGNDDCLHEMDIANGYTGNTICGPWYYSQRGVAYDPATDTWFVGSWNDYTIYHIDSMGNLLDSAYVGLGISGLAYNPDTLHLFVMVNSYDEPIYVLDVANNYASVGQFYIDGWPGYYNGAGLEIDCDGNLWAVAQTQQTVFEFDSGESASLCGAGKDAPWLTEHPQTGSLLADGTFPVELTFTAFPSMSIGTYYTGTLYIKSSDPVSDTFMVPVTLTVIQPEIAVSLAPTATAKSSPPGTTVQYLLTVQNIGNVPDTYDLSTVNEDWPVLMTTHQVSLDPGESAKIPIFVFIPASAEDGEIDEMSVIAASQADQVIGLDVSATTGLSTRAFYTRIVRLTPAQASAIGDNGEVIEYTLTLWNLSLVSDTITLQSQSGWVVDLSGTEFVLDSFESVEVTVRVHVPWNAVPGDLDTVLITATSQSDPSAWDRTRLSTFSGMMRIFMPIIAKTR